MQIKYPKENKVIRISNKKPKENIQNNELKSQIERMRYQIDELETSSIEMRQNSSSNKIEQIENRITANNTAISGLSNRLAADEQSISNNSTAIGQTNNTVSQISSDLQTLSNNYTITSNQVNVHTQQISNMIPHINENMLDIANLEEQVAQNITDIADLKANGTGGSGGSVVLDSTPTQNSTNAVTSGGVFSALATKQNQLTAGTNITIDENNNISANVDTSALQSKLTAGTGITINEQNVISSNIDTTGLQNQITTNADNISSLQSSNQTNATNIRNLQLQASANTSNIVSLQNGKQNKLTAGTGITISQDNTISTSLDTSGLQPKLTAGTGITIDQDNVISAIGGSSAYIAGNNISIENGVISATDTTYSAGENITIQNGVISATAGSGLSEITASDVNSEQATSGQVLTADGNGGAIWQNASSGSGEGSGDFSNEILELQNDAEKKFQILKILNERLKVLEMKNEEDKTVYNERIYNEHDRYERDLEINKTNIAISPSVLFCIEPSLSYVNTSGIQTTKNPEITSTTRLKFSSNVADTITFVLYDSGTALLTTSKSIDSNNVNIEQSITIKVKVTTNTDSHNYYIIATSSNTQTSITLTYISMDLVAPNVTIMNKIRPFNVEYNYYTNKYYLSDCSSGYAKIAEIDANNLHSTNDIIWTQTNIEAQCYKPFFVAERDCDVTSSVGKQFALITNKNNTIKLVDLADLTNSYTFEEGTHTASASYTIHNYSHIFRSYAYKSTIQSYRSEFDQNLNMTFNMYMVNRKNITQMSAARDNKDYLSYTIDKKPAIVTLKTGYAYFTTGESTRDYYRQKFIQDAKLYVIDYNHSGEYHMDAFFKFFGKYYKSALSYVGEVLRFENFVELGEFDDLFYGKKNDYFVVKNGKIEYMPTLN